MGRLWRHNAVTLLCDGAEFFPALLASLNAARRQIQLETYIFRIDATGERIARALMAAARRGVEVNVLLDGFGCADFPDHWLNALRAAGVNVRFFRPEVLRWWPRRSRLRRLHRKLALIDAHTAFVGGINLHDDRDNAGPEDAPRYDYAVRVCGPVVADIQHTMRQLWLSVAFGPLVARGPQALTRLLNKSQELHADTRPAGVQSARLLVRDNGRHRLSIEQSYLRQIRRAQHEILIANAYFLPGLRLRHALCDAARRGVKVKLLLQGRVDHAILHYATRMLYRDFLNSGIEIHEYQAGYMHAKVAVIDRRWAMVGSSNIDPFSLLLAREANLQIQHADFAQSLRRHMLHKIQRHARQVAPQELTQASLPKRALVWLCYGLVRAGIQVSGYGGGYYQE